MTPDPLDDLRLRLRDAADDVERRALLAAILRARRYTTLPSVVLGRWSEEGKEVPARLFTWQDTPLGSFVLVLSSRGGWHLLAAADIEEASPSCYRVRPPRPPPTAGPLRFLLAHARMERNRDAILRAVQNLAIPLRLSIAPQPAVAGAMADVQPFFAALPLTPLRG